MSGGSFKIPHPECCEIQPYEFARGRERYMIHLGIGSAIDQKGFGILLHFTGITFCTIVDTQK